MATLKPKKTKIEDAVVGAYQKIEDTVVGTYQKIEDTVVDTYQKIEDKFVDKFLEGDDDSAICRTSSPYMPDVWTEADIWKNAVPQ